MTLFKILFRICILLVLCHSNGFAQDFLNYANSLKYATFLFETKQYHESAIEFERVVFLASNDTSAKLQLIKSYRYSGNYFKAKSRLENIFPENINLLPTDFAKEYVKILLHENQYDSLTYYINHNKNLSLSDAIGFQYGSLIMQNKWREAMIFENNNLNTLTRFDAFYALKELEKTGLKIKYKNPLLASGMSALIPGSGKIYTNQWKDAIYSFLFVSAASFITYKCYENNGFSNSTIIFGSITASFYLANIYGTHKSAKRYNQSINHNYKHKAEDILLNN